MGSGSALQFLKTIGEDRLLVEDAGTHTNPELYKVTNGFRSAVVTRAGAAATALWTVATTPARTAGRNTHIYAFMFYNHSGAAATAWIEIGGVQVSLTIPLNNGQAATVTLTSPLPMGDNDIDINASANDVDGQISGLEPV